MFHKFTNSKRYIVFLGGIIAVLMVLYSYNSTGDLVDGLFFIFLASTVIAYRIFTKNYAVKIPVRPRTLSGIYPRINPFQLVEGTMPPDYIQKYVSSIGIRAGLWYETERDLAKDWLILRDTGIDFYCRGYAPFIPLHEELCLEYSTNAPDTYFLDVAFDAAKVPAVLSGQLKEIYELYGDRLPVFSELTEQSMTLVKKLADKGGISCKEVPYREI